jgi:DNA-binding NarL/FixJ family response regulator
MELKELDEPEFEIAQMADEGFSVRHIAARLDLTERAAAARPRIVLAKHVYF